MDRKVTTPIDQWVVLAVALVAALVVLVGGGSFYGAVINAVIWGGVAAIVVWARSRWKARRS